MLGRIQNGFRLIRARCGADMRIIAFITDAAVARDFLLHLTEPLTPPTIAPAWGPPLWAAIDAAAIDSIPPENTFALPLAALVFDQRSAWWSVVRAPPPRSQGLLPPATADDPKSARQRSISRAIDLGICLSSAQTVGLRRVIAA